MQWKKVCTYIVFIFITIFHALLEDGADSASKQKITDVRHGQPHPGSWCYLFQHVLTPHPYSYSSLSPLPPPQPLPPTCTTTSASIPVTPPTTTTTVTSAATPPLTSAPAPPLQRFISTIPPLRQPLDTCHSTSSVTLIRLRLPTSRLVRELADLLEGWIDLTPFCSCLASFSRCWSWLLGVLSFQLSSELTLHTLPSKNMVLRRLVLVVRRPTPPWTLLSLF